MDRLDELGSAAELPDQAVWSEVEARFAVWGRPLGRISEVATWWAGVRGLPDAKAPTKIAHVGPAERQEQENGCGESPKKAHFDLIIAIP